jgi:hypothetical protein
MAEVPQTPAPTTPTGPTTPPTTTTTPPIDTTTARPRKKSKGILKWTLLILLLLIVGGGALLYINLNRIVRATVEKQSAASLNVPTKLGGANLNLFGGDVSLSDFTIGSPAGFNADRMLSLGEVNVQSSISGLRGDPVQIETLDVVRPRMVIEMKGRDFNIKKFVDALPQGDTKPADEEKPLKLAIGKLTVTGAEVVFRPDASVLSSIPGLKADSIKLKDEYNLQIPTLELNNVGTAEGSQNGAAVKDVVTLLITSLASKATQSDQLPPELRSLLSGDVNAMIDVAKAKIGEEMNKQVGKITADLKEKIGGELGGAVGGILNDPNKLKEDPGAAIQQELGGLLNKDKDTSTTTQPSQKQDGQDAIKQGLGGLLNKKKPAATQPK